MRADIKSPQPKGAHSRCHTTAAGSLLISVMGPGLAVLAEIKTGQRRIIQYLLSLFTKSPDEAGRER